MKFVRGGPGVPLAPPWSAHNSPRLPPHRSMFFRAHCVAAPAIGSAVVDKTSDWGAVKLDLLRSAVLCRLACSPAATPVAILKVRRRAVGARC
jgi:hypothetical protein